MYEYGGECLWDPRWCGANTGELGEQPELLASEPRKVFMEEPPIGSSTITR